MEHDIAKIYEEYSKMIYNYLYCLCFDNTLSEDLTQETFYYATKGIDKFRNDCKIQVWLCEIAKNLWFKELKRRKRTVIVSIESEFGEIGETKEIASEENVEDKFIEKEEKIELYKNLKKLTNIERQLIHLRLTSGLNFKDISQIYKKSESWARVIYYRGKEKLREMYEKEEQ